MSEIIFRLTGERTTQNLKNLRNSSLWTYYGHINEPK